MSTIGLDLGTSGVRAAGYDAQGREIASATRSTVLTRPHPDWLVFDAEAVLASCESVVAEAAAAAATSGDPVAAIGFSSQGEAIVPVDRRGRALAWCPVGMDARGETAAQAMSERLGADRVQQITGQPLHRMFSIYKIAVGDRSWQRPAATGYRTLADFVAARWGAAPATDWTSAARTGIFDVATTTWSGVLIDAVAQDAPWVGEVHISEPVLPGTPLGTVTADAADRLGVSSSTQLVAGLHDQAASFVGAGGHAGSVSTFAFGSSDCLTVETAQRPWSIHGTGFATYPWRADGHWLTLGGTAAGGWALDWYAALMGAAHPAELVGEVSGTPPGLIVLPYLAGSGTYDNDPAGTGAVIGLTLATTRAELTRAFVEAGGYELGLLAAAFEAAGLVVGDIRAVGSGAGSSRALQIRASAANVPLTPVHQQASARGAALLAGSAIGAVDLDDLPAADLGATVGPDPASIGWYADQRRTYRDLYLSLRALRLRRGEQPPAGSDGLPAHTSSPARASADDPGRPAHSSPIR